MRRRIPRGSGNSARTGHSWTASLISGSDSRASTTSLSSADIPACSSIRWQAGRWFLRMISMVADQPVRGLHSVFGFAPSRRTAPPCLPACSTTLPAAEPSTTMRRNPTGAAPGSISTRALCSSSRCNVRPRSVVVPAPPKSAVGTIRDFSRISGSRPMACRLPTRTARSSPHASR